MVILPPLFLFLFLSGADDVMLNNMKLELKGGNDDAVARDSLSDFANQGLRTLVLCKAELDEQRYKEWNEKFLAASISNDDRDKKLEILAKEFRFAFLFFLAFLALG
jgi:hypothetical protein